jgi:hypothetical protein
MTPGTRIGPYEVTAPLGAVSADGQRFLVREPAANPATAPLHVLLNWPALLAQ